MRQEKYFEKTGTTPETEKVKTLVEELDIIR